MKRSVSLLLVLLFLLLLITGCQEKKSEYVEIQEAYIEAFDQFFELGNEYMEQGLRIQANYAYGISAANTSAMRYCVDCLLYLKGEGSSLEEVTGDRLADWDKIAALNYATSYPYFFEAIVYDVQGKREEALNCYQYAIVNPRINAENDQYLKLLDLLSVDQLKQLKTKLCALEDKIFAKYTPQENNYPRDYMCFDDGYLRLKAKEALDADFLDYRGALKHYKAALAVNPYEGDNFAGCALMSIFLNDMADASYYLNEGLYVDPEHKGLLELAEIFSEGE